MFCRRFPMFSKNVGVMLFLFAVVLLAVCGGPGVQAQESQTKDKAVVLFDGKSLDGWDYHLVDPDLKMEDVWSVKDGILICKGKPFGYLHTKKDYQDFQLTFQWRWAPGADPGNSGVLLRITGEPIGFMPKCVEAQLMHGSAGDIWAFFGFGVKGPGSRYREVKDHEALGTFYGVGASRKAEKPAGEWNTYDIVFQGDKLTLTINGEQVNEASGCDHVAGKIGLQSEGAEIHFRNVKIVPLD